VTDLLAARSQMAVSLGFHIIFAVVGIGMPVLMVLAERRWRRTGDRISLELAGALDAGRGGPRPLSLALLSALDLQAPALIAG